MQVPSRRAGVVVLLALALGLEPAPAEGADADGEASVAESAGTVEAAAPAQPGKVKDRTTEGPPTTRSDAERAAEIKRFFEEEYDPLFDEDFELVESEGFKDPIEGFNRSIMKFNQGVNRWALRPVARAFDWLIPDPVKLPVRKLFQNLNTPVVLANDLLQLEWKDAGITTGAFLVNSTIGIAGLFEPAKYIGMPRHRSDFGQTLALARVPSGPYLMIPILGPSTVRGVTGSAVNSLMRPVTWIFGLGNFAFLFTGTEAIVVLEQHYRDLIELEESAVDFYPVLRSAYYQNRMNEIWHRRESRRLPRDHDE